MMAVAMKQNIPSAFPSPPPSNDKLHLEALGSF
jgi:hypothetical protein